ncbi:ependymin-related protein 1-like [Haliotis rubra]|uniref:ependymin-related protein 1-like n=1 Tax=Haliotis rubra TaxID=36100 RepID=UPI001EE5D5FE|nr:ependymin-related protein 1-like [Haliotis rubra]
MILQAALVLAGLTVASGSLCCQPRQFNAFQYVTYVNSTSTLRALYFIVYDGINERYLITGDRNNRKFVGTTKVIYDYRKRIGYNIDAEARTCTTFPVRGNFRDQENVCVPSGAVSVGPFFYGYNQNRLNSQSYTYNSTTADGRQQNVVTTITETNCVPIVISTITYGSPGGNSNTMVGYNDFYPGIRDITVFDIPPYCNE